MSGTLRQNVRRMRDGSHYRHWRRARTTSSTVQTIEPIHDDALNGLEVQSVKNAGVRWQPLLTSKHVVSRGRIELQRWLVQFPTFPFLVAAWGLSSMAKCLAFGNSEASEGGEKLANK